MAPPDPADDAPAPDGVGLLERLGDQVAALATRVAEIDTRMTSVEAGAPGSGEPVEVQLSPETVAQIAEALAGLQAAGGQALDDAFKSASDDLTDALSKLVTSEISRTLADAGYDVVVTETVEPATADESFEHDTGSDAAAVVAESDVDGLPEPEPMASATMPSIVAPLTSSPAESGYDADESEDTAAEVAPDGPPLTLEDLDDPLLDALIRKEPLSA